MEYHVLVYRSASDTFDCHTTAATLKEAERVADNLLDRGEFVQIERAE